MSLQRTGIEAMGASRVKAKEHCVCLCVWWGGAEGWGRSSWDGEARVIQDQKNTYFYKLILS